MHTNFLTILINLFCCRAERCLSLWIHGWLGKKLNDTSLFEKENFYSHLNMEDLTDTDYTHAKRVCNNFEIKNLGEYHDLYLQSDTLFLADVFNNFWNKCIEI